MAEDLLTYGHRLEQHIADTSALAWRDARTTASSCSSRAPRARCSTSTTAPIRSSPRRNPVAGAACIGAGVGPRDIDEVWGIAKAYATRVGAGPFPTELHDEIGEQLRENGGEFGTTTGRPRRTGWLDLVALRYAARINTLTALAITKLDVLTGFETIQVCHELPAAPTTRRSRLPLPPVGAAPRPGEYDELPGWDEDITELPLRGRPAAGRARLPAFIAEQRRRAGRAGRRRARPRPDHLDRRRRSVDEPDVLHRRRRVTRLGAQPSSSSSETWRTMPRRNAHDHAARRHVVGDDGAGGDERLLADLDARHEHRAAADAAGRGAGRALAARSPGRRRPIVSSLVVIAHGPTKTSSSTTLKAVM